jgi:hypothetical protein
MKLYKITWETNVGIPDFFSPQFLEAPDELKVLSKFITLYESKSVKVAPKNIQTTQICSIDKIIKYNE